jgi:uncharacterized protein (TIGR02996 family)
MNDDEPFIERVLARRASDEPRLEYAARLEQRGDPRGEFIRLQCERARLPPDNPQFEAVRARERELLGLHESSWSAPISDWAKNWHFERGFIQGIAIDVHAFVEHMDELFTHAPISTVKLLGEAPVAGWAQGRWDRERLRNIHYLDLSAFEVDSAIVCQMLSSTHLAPVGFISFSDLNCNVETAEALAAAGHLERIESLFFLGHIDADMRGRPIELLAGSAQLRSLKSIDLRETNLGPDDMQALANSPFINGLEQLDLGDGLYSANTIGAKGMQAIAGSANFAHLNRLHADFNGVGDAGMKALAASKHVTNLRHLDLVSNGIGPKGIAAFARSENCAALQILDLSGNPIGDNGVYELARSAKFQAKRLSLSGTSLTDKGMKYLAAAPWLAGLNELRLTANDLTAKSFRLLLDNTAFHGIKRLRLNQSQLQDAGCEEEMRQRFGEKLEVEMLVLPSMHASLA